MAAFATPQRSPQVPEWHKGVVIELALAPAYDLDPQKVVRWYKAQTEDPATPVLGYSIDSKGLVARVRVPKKVREEGYEPAAALCLDMGMVVDAMRHDWEHA